MTLDLSNMQRVQSGLDATIDAGVEEIANTTADLQQEAAPEDTGALKASKVVRKIESGVWEISFGEGLPDARALYTEFGTLHQAAQPWFYPALEQVDRAAIMQSHLDALIGGG